MEDIIKLLRVKHYIKNLLILVPLFFSKNILQTDKIISSIIGVVAFSLCCSAVYIINDIRDVEKDKKHPIKKERPIASGKISIKKAIVIGVILIILSILCTIAIYKLYSINIYSTITYLLLYLVLNIAYSFGLKNKPIIDITILSLGFLIRVLFGGVIIDVNISNWLYLTVISISFYLGLGKRRNELVKHNNKETRSVLKYYTKDFLDKNMYVCMALSIVFYSLWAMSFSNNLMLWTIPIVMLIAMKYSLDIELAGSEGDPVDIIVKDKMIVLMSIFYVIYTFLIIYLFQ